ncbi:MAG: SusD/RagB family nutrient-binding outer membrane lipoprotein [Bacteroidota bacterium]
MKKVTKTIQAIAVIVPLLLTSCEIAEVNVNPNNPTEVPENVILPFAEESIARLMAGSGQVMAGIFVQYYEGIDNHPRQVQQYVVNEALYVEWDWNDYYDGPMININKMIEVAKANGNHYYTGIGNTLMALCLGNVTSLWGDVPYSEAFNSSIKSPRFDSQKSIYETIQTLLDSAIVNFNKSYNGEKPNADDIIFGGDIAKWKKVAYALKARYYLHLTKRVVDLDFNPAQKALEACQYALGSTSDDMQFPYGYSASEYNPFYSFTRLGYIIPNINLTSLLSALNDPRKDYYYKKKFGVATLENSYFTSPNSPVFMITYHELKFIEAEARLRLDANDPLAQAALQDAVRANLTKICGVELPQSTIDNYVATNATLSGDFENKLKTIIRQKYIAMFASIETWTDYRRTGYPVLIPNPNGDNPQNPGGAIPRRLAYPQTERLYNKNFPTPLPTLQDRFWWDQ